MGTARRRIHVVVAEDDPAMASLLVDVLEADGHHVTLVVDGAQLVAYIAGLSPEETIDLVVADVHLPRKSGLEALAEIRASPWPTPLLLITADTDPRIERDGARLGAIGTLRKPFELEDLRIMVALFATAR